MNNTYFIINTSGSGHYEVKDDDGVLTLYSWEHDQSWCKPGSRILSFCTGNCDLEIIDSKMSIWELAIFWDFLEKYYNHLTDMDTYVYARLEKSED